MRRTVSVLLRGVETARVYADPELRSPYFTRALEVALRAFLGAQREPRNEQPRGPPNASSKHAPAPAIPRRQTPPGRARRGRNGGLRGTPKMRLPNTFQPRRSLDGARRRKGLCAGLSWRAFNKRTRCETSKFLRLRPSCEKNEEPRRLHPHPLATERRAVDRAVLYTHQTMRALKR